MGWARNGLLPALAGDRPPSLLPDGEAIAGAYLLGVLEKARRTCNDATGQPEEEGVVKSLVRALPDSPGAASTAECSLLLGMAPLTSPQSSP